MRPLICYVCQTKCFFYQQNIKNIKSKHSNRPVIRFIEIFAKNVNLNRSTLESETSCLCYECIDKIDVYDLAKSTIDEIENEMQNHLTRGNGSKIESPSNCKGINQSSQNPKATQSESKLVEDSSQNGVEPEDENGMEQDGDSQGVNSMNGSCFSGNNDAEDDDDNDDGNVDITDMYITDIKEVCVSRFSVLKFILNWKFINLVFF